MKKPIKYYVWRFALYYLVTLFAVIAVVAMLSQFAPRAAFFIFGGSASIGVSVAMLLVAPMILAGKFYRTEGRAFTRKEAWALAALGTVVIVTLTVGVTFAMNLVAFGTLSGRGSFARMAQDPLGVAVVVLVVLVVLTLMTRLFLWLGMRNEVKRAGL